LVANPRDAGWLSLHCNYSFILQSADAAANSRDDDATFYGFQDTAVLHRNAIWRMREYGISLRRFSTGIN
jgi:hypothetical protein